MKPVLRASATALALLALAACGTTTTKSFPSSGTLLPNTSIRFSPEVSYTVEQLALAALVGGAIYAIYDPLAPNWRIDETALGDASYHLALKAKSFRVGGDGEAWQIVKRRAQQLQRERGYAGYRIVDFSEGIESSTPLTHRVSEGTILLVGAPTQ